MDIGVTMLERFPTPALSGSGSKGCPSWCIGLSVETPLASWRYVIVKLCNFRTKLTSMPRFVKGFQAISRGADTGNEEGKDYDFLNRSMVSRTSCSRRIASLQKFQMW